MDKRSGLLIKVLLGFSLFAAGASFIAGLVLHDFYFLLIASLNVAVSAYDLSLLSLKEEESE